MMQYMCSVSIVYVPIANSHRVAHGGKFCVDGFYICELATLSVFHSISAQTSAALRGTHLHKLKNRRFCLFESF